MDCIPNYTKKQWIMISSLVLVTLSSSLCASLQAPFYPHEAEKKGATPTEYGLVFGIFELVSFICCPIIGKNMGKVGAGRILKCGIMVTGASTLVFGLLDLVNVHWVFLTLSFILRSIEALGVSAIFTASLAIVVVVFEDSFARVFTILEILQGLGYMTGPTVGGYLFEIGGFLFPFAAVGCFVLMAGLYTIFTLPNVDTDEMKNKPQTQLLSVVRLVPVALDAMCLAVQAMSIGFLTATLEPHLRQFNLTPTMLGLVFVIGGTVYMVCAPMVGVLCDKRFNTKRMILLGCFLNVLSVMFIGPMPYTPLDTTLWMVGVGLFVDGLGMSFMFVPAFVDAISSAIKYGLPDDINTYAMVSGIYGSAFALGAFIGPSVAGALFDAVGFRKATLFIITVHSTTFMAVLLFLLYEKSYDRKHGIGIEPGSHANENGDYLAANLMSEPEALCPEDREDVLVRRATVVKMNGDDATVDPVDIDVSNGVDKRDTDVVDFGASEKRLSIREGEEETVEIRL